MGTISEATDSEVRLPWLLRSFFTWRHVSGWLRLSRAAVSVVPCRDISTTSAHTDSHHGSVRDAITVNARSNRHFLSGQEEFRWPDWHAALRRFLHGNHFRVSGRMKICDVDVSVECAADDSAFMHNCHAKGNLACFERPSSAESKTGLGTTFSARLIDGNYYDQDATGN